MTAPPFGIVPAISPAEGSPLGGQAVTITGTGLSATAAVTFGSTPATQVRPVSATQLQVVTPPAEPGQVTVTVTRGSEPPLLLGFVYSDLVMDVVRPDDLLALSFQLVNLQLSAGSLIPIDPGAPATIVVQLPPQHVTENAYPVDATGNITPGHPPITAVLAGASRLAFSLPDGLASLPLSLPALLNWAQLIPVPPGPPATQPTGTQTAIELPYRLVLGIDNASWQHPVQAIVDPATGAAEVWRTRAEAPQAHVTWSPDLDAPPPPSAGGPPGPPDVAGPLTPEQRAELASEAPALTIGALAMSALGASADLRADGLTGPELAGWHQIVSHGRDSYVRIVQPGCTGPFGHPTNIITVFERIPATSASDGTGTVSAEALAMTQTLAFPQPVMDYTDSESVSAYLTQGQQMALPFRSVRIVNPVTPPIQVLGQQPGQPLPAGPIVDVSGNLFQFHVVVEDLSGATADMSVPMVFIPLSGVPQAPAIYAGAANSSDLSAQLSGQPIAFVGQPGTAPTVPAAGDASVLVVNSMTFKVMTTPGTSQAHPFFASMDTAQVTLPAVNRLTGSPGSAAISYNQTYLSDGIDPAVNRGGVFADLHQQPPVAISADLAGGLAAPQLPIDGLSRTHGAVPGAAGLINGSFNPSALLATLGSATLLGNIPLAEILAAVGVSDFDPSKVPALTHVQLPDAVRTTFTWSPPVSQDGLNLPGVSIDTSGATLSLTFQADAPLTGGSPTADISGQLTSIVLTFIGAVQLSIDSLSFQAHAGQKVELTTGKNLAISFTGDLAFLNELARALPPDGFADPPFFDATADGVTAGYTLGLPSIAVGIISIENISFEAALSLPFTAPLGLKLAFATRDNPFLVTVSLIGGGGYLGIEVGAEGIRQIEGAIDLGASISVDLAIVTANVHVLAGFYFGMTTDATGTRTTFSAFLRIGGEVDLLGIISVSIELYLQLTYASATDHSSITGTATLTLSVHVLFVTKSFTLSVQKTFAVPGASGSAIAAADAAAGGPVSFDELITLADWQTYCAAFA
jgi:IPT/TIG domain